VSSSKSEKNPTYLLALIGMALHKLVAWKRRIQQLVEQNRKKKMLKDPQRRINYQASHPFYYIIIK
jgi:hypothetical protein